MNIYAYFSTHLCTCRTQWVIIALNTLCTWPHVPCVGQHVACLRLRSIPLMLPSRTWHEILIFLYQNLIPCKTPGVYFNIRAISMGNPGQRMTFFKLKQHGIHSYPWLFIEKLIAELHVSSWHARHLNFTYVFRWSILYLGLSQIYCCSPLKVDNPEVVIWKCYFIKGYFTGKDHYGSIHQGWYRPILSSPMKRNNRNVEKKYHWQLTKSEISS